MKTRDQRIIRLATELLQEIRNAGYPLNSYPGGHCAGVDIEQFDYDWGRKKITVTCMSSNWEVDGDTTDNFFNFLPKEDKPSDEEREET